MKVMHFTHIDNVDSILENGLHKSINDKKNPQWLGDGYYFFPYYSGEMGSQTYNEVAHEQGTGLVKRHLPRSERKNARYARIIHLIPLEQVTVFDMDDSDDFKQFDYYFKESIKDLPRQEYIELSDLYDRMMNVFKNKQPFSKYALEFGHFLGSIMDELYNAAEDQIDVIAMSFIPGRYKHRKASHPLYDHIGLKLVREICVKNEKLVLNCESMNIDEVL